MQNTLMKFDPAFRTERPYPSHAAQYREFHGNVAWLFNPWTGDKRHPADIGSDVTGLLIRFAGEQIVSAAAPNEDLFVTVPEVTLPNGTVVPSFKVGQYACTQGKDGKAAVRAGDKPWVRIKYADARKACRDAGYNLITEFQWLAIAHDAAGQGVNWTEGEVGKGSLFQGIRNGNVSSAQAGDYEPTDPDERRWLVLSNGARICDMNGNVWQWVFDNVQGNADGLISRAFAEDSPSLSIAPYPSEKKGVGYRPSACADWSGLALVRGGCWNSGAFAGVFLLGSGWPGDGGDVVGFRCTKP